MGWRKFCGWLLRTLGWTAVEPLPEEKKCILLGVPHTTVWDFFISYLYFKSIDPLSLNKQGEDEGTQYRTGIYYTDPSDLQVIDKAFRAVEEAVRQPLAVEKLPLQNFFTAEEYHQDYLDKNPTGYCHLPAALFEYARNSNK